MVVKFTLRQLEYFVAVGECGSIAAAGEKLNVSSPAISASILQLEAVLGISLFTRKHAQGLMLTRAGEEILSKSKGLLQCADDLNAHVNEISDSIKGQLKIAALVTFAAILVPRLRSSFEKLYTEVKITHTEMDQAAIYKALHKAEIDLALTYDLNIPPDFQFFPFLELPPFVLMSVEHPLANMDQVSPADIVAHPLVLLDLPYSSKYFLSFFNDLEEKPNIAERTKDIAVMRSLVANGFGYSIANVLPQNCQSPDGQPLKCVPLKSNKNPVKLGALTTQGTRNSRTVRKFIEHCSEFISQTADFNFGISNTNPQISTGAKN